MITGIQPNSRKAAARRRHRRGRQGGAVQASSGAVSEINVTPFVDVVLVLLIIFMVVTPMLQRGVDVLLPLSDHHKKSKDTGEQVFISVRRDGAVFLGQDLVDLKRLEAQLRPLMLQQPPPPIFVKGDSRLNFAPVREVLEVCHQAGATNVALATEKRKQGEE